MFTYIATSIAAVWPRPKASEKPPLIEAIEENLAATQSLTETICRADETVTQLHDRRVANPALHPMRRRADSC